MLLALNIKAEIDNDGMPSACTENNFSDNHVSIRPWRRTTSPLGTGNGFSNMTSIPQSTDGIYGN